MTTEEKLLAQIFERKESIIEQVNQQTELYRQHLASKCLIDGIAPPSWLWNPNSSDSQELSKDELISKILCPYPQSSARWSFAHYPGYNNLVTTGDNEEFCDRVSVENQAFCEGLNRQDDPPVPALSTDDHAECTLNFVPELDSSVTLPDDHTDERISNIYCAPDQSLVKRSKSRQKAFEFRSSAKALVKSGLGHVNVDDVDSRQIRFSLSATRQEGQNNLVTTGDNEEFCDRVSVENQAFCEGLNRQDDPPVPALSTDDHAECTLNFVPELDSSVTLPDDHTDERISNIYCAPDQSLVKRSKSRQKAFEFRSSAKALVKSGLGHVNVDDVDSRQIRFSLSATRQEGQNDELPQLAEPRAVGGHCCEEMNLDEADCTSREIGKTTLELQGSAKAAKSSLRYEHINDVESNQIRLSVSVTDQAGQNDELPQLAEPCAVDGQSCEEMNLDEADCTSRKIGKKAVEIQGSSAKAAKSSLRFEHIYDVESSQIRLSLSATDQAGQNDELPQLAEPRAVGGHCCEEMNLDEADCTSREIGKTTFELQGSAKAAKSSLRYEHINDVESNQIRLSVSATDQAGQNDELPQLAEPCAVDGQSCEEMNLDEADCTSREIGKKAVELQGSSAKAAKSSLRFEHINDVESSQIRLSLSATDQAGQNDELPQLAEPRSVGGHCCEEMNLEEADCTSREIGKKALELQGSAKAAKSSLRYEHINDVESNQIRLSVSAMDQAGQNDELPQLAEPCVVGGQSCEEMSLDEADCTSREIGEKAVELQGSSAKAAKSSLRFEHINDVESSQIRLSLFATDQAGQNDELFQLAEPRAVGGQSCEEMKLDEADCSSREIGKKAVELQGSAKAAKSSLRFEHINDVESSQIRLSVSATDQEGQNDELPQLAEPCAVGGQSCEEMNLDEADCTSREMGMGTYSDMITWSRSPTKVPISVKGSLILDCSSEDCKENTFSHVAKARRTESMPIPHSERADTCINFSKSVGPSDTCRHSCGDRRVDDASFPIKDTENNVLGTHTAVRLHGENSIPDGSLRHMSMESWPQVKRRKLECQQANSFTTSPSFRVKKHHNIHRSPVSIYLKSMEISTDTAFMEHVNESTDIRIFPERNSSLKEGNVSKHGEVGSCCKDKTDNKASPSDVDNRELEASLVSSLPLIESRNSQGCFLKGVRTSLSSSNLFDARMLGNEQCSENLCYLEKSAEDLQHSVLSQSNEELQLADVDQSIPEFESFIVDSQTNSGELNFASDRFHLDELNRPRTTLERASILAEICRSASLDRPSYQFSSDFEFQETENIFKSVPNSVNLEHWDLGDTFPLSFDVGKHVQSVSSSPDDYKDTIDGMPCSVSASLDRPSYQFSSDFEFQETQNKFQSVPNSVNLEHLNLGDTFPLSSDVGKHLQSGSSSSDDYKDTVDGMPYSVSLSYSGARYGWNTRNQYPSPVGKLWDRPSSYTGSSEKRLSSNPELTCFPIEEDPSISEENKTVDENAGDTQEEINSSLANHCDERKLLKDLTNQNLSVSAEEEIFNTDTVDFVSTKFNVTGAQEKAPCGPRGSKYQLRNKSGVSENQTSSAGTVDVRTNQPSHVSANRIKKAKESTNNSISKPNVSNKTSLKGHDQKLSLRGSTRNNIVSNVSSFIPLVQQKQAATACTGKRDVKVKALEAAEAAKRLEEKKENERKLKKEAMKLEREEKNLRQMELEKKKKEEERKKKDADMAKKRLREEEERKDKEKKRMRPDVKQRQREKEEKKRAEKAEKEKENHQSKDQQFNSTESYGEPKKQLSETARGDGVALQNTETKLTLTGVVMNHGECGTSVITGEVEKAMHSVDKSPRKEDLIAQNSLAKSYEISPYQCSDDDAEEDDELPTKKYIPSWASKNSVAMFLPLQQKLDPDVIFPIESFCSMDEVLLPRKLQQSWVAT